MTLPRPFGLLLTALVGVFSSSASLPPPVDEFADYWFQGQAELTSYTLEQARYGEVHPGQAVLIFVTEDFSRRKQVKLDNGAAAGDDRVPVMKLNLTKHFNTGIYPYSMMTSSFRPLDLVGSPRTLKTTTTVQEWCGHTFEQLNRTASGYRAELRSYFESEGDQNVELADAVLEDGLWSLIRLDPSALPTGRLSMIPSAMFQRLRHTDLLAHAALARLEDDGAELSSYSLRYPELGRTLTIRFRQSFPHEIESWEESYRSGFGADAAVLTTRAVRKQRMKLAYWNHNSLADAGLRAELGL